ncbi:hypothetical protein ABIF95_000136 [Bradyrhizobium ottawaense]
MDRDLHIDRRVRRDDHVGGADLVARAGRHDHVATRLTDAFNAGVGVELRPAALKCAGQSGKISGRVQARLAGKAQRAHQTSRMEYGRLGAIFDGNPELATAIQFCIQLGCRGFGRLHPVAVDTPKITIDVLIALNGLGAGDCGFDALIIVPRTIWAADPDQFAVAIVERRRQMRRGARRHPATNAAAIEHRDGASMAGQFISHGQPGYSRADDNDVHGHGARQRGGIRDRNIHPERSRVLVPYVHDAAPSKRTTMRQNVGSCPPCAAQTPSKVPALIRNLRRARA